MGASGSSKESNISKTKECVSKSLCKIMLNNNVSGTGFLIKFFKSQEKFFCLMSCEQIISKQLIQNKEKIGFYYNNENEYKEIILDQNKRYIKNFEEIDIDATIIEILEKDKIEEENFLLPDINHMNNLTKLNKEIIHIPRFPSERNIELSEYKIVKLNKNEFTYQGNAGECSPGSPILLKNSSKMIGINKGGNLKGDENYAYFIGPIYNFIKNGLIHIMIDESNNFSDDEESKLLIDNENLSNENFEPSNDLNDYYLSKKNIPEILKIYSDTEHIELKFNDDQYKYLTLKEYLETIKSENIKYSCMFCENKVIKVIYCIKCKDYICSECLSKNPKDHSKFCVPFNKLGNTCLVHNEEEDIICEDCLKNVCDKCFDNFHKKHKKFKFEKSDIKKARSEIYDKNLKLLKLKEFYDMVQLASESDPDNALYRKNLKNVANFIEKEKRRDKFDIDLAIYRSEQMKKGINYKEY